MILTTCIPLVLYSTSSSAVFAGFLIHEREDEKALSFEDTTHLYLSHHHLVLAIMQWFSGTLIDTPTPRNLRIRRDHLIGTLCPLAAESLEAMGEK